LLIDIIFFSEKEKATFLLNGINAFTAFRPIQKVSIMGHFANKYNGKKLNL